MVSLLLLILETVVPPLPAWPILVANAAIFGIWGGIALSWLGGLLGAVIAFWMARTFARSYLERFIRSEHLETIDAISREKGFQILLIARVFPVTSVDLLSFLAGLSSIPFGRFLLATSLGLLPGVALYTLFAHDLLLTRAVTTRLSLSAGGALLVYALYRLHKRRTLRKPSSFCHRVNNPVIRCDEGREGRGLPLEELNAHTDSPTNGGV